MKKILKKIISNCIKLDLVYFIFKKSIIPISNIIKEERIIYDRSKLLKDNPEVQEIFSELIVLNGPFKGVRYPNFVSYGSTLFSKLIGSYECELHDLISSISNKNYLNIVDIGCAEGYYAIGLAKVFPNSIVYAYDTSTEALLLCKEMGEINGLGNRLILNQFCSVDTLINFNFSKKSLIICDCEGFEKQLFSKESIKNLISCDILIETHDLYDNSISYLLEDLFKDTHKLTRILSTGDLQKVKNSKFKQIEHLSFSNRKIILEELRGEIMEWHFYESIKS